MARVFFPSCKIKADFPAESEDVRRYLEKQHGVTTTGCCKPCRTQLTDVDQAVAPPKVTVIYGQCLVGEQDCARAER